MKEYTICPICGKVAYHSSHFKAFTCGRCGWFKYADEAKLTNADRLKGMSDEEFAEFIVLSPEMEFEVCCYCKYGNTVLDDRGQCLAPRGHCIAQNRCDAFKIWLKQPAEEG